MKRIVCAAMLVCLTITACVPFLFHEACDGLWEPMEWSHPRYETVKMDGEKYYLVPVEGGSFGFRCKNYRGPWLGTHKFIVRGETTYSYQDEDRAEDSFSHYENDWCRVTAEGDSIKVWFDANKSTVRRAIIGVTAGDIFDEFKFLQGSELYTE